MRCSTSWSTPNPDGRREHAERWRNGPLGATQPSARLRTSLDVVTAALEAQIVELPNRLIGEGLDAGALRWHLNRRAPIDALIDPAPLSVYFSASLMDAFTVPTGTGTNSTRADPVRRVPPGVQASGGQRACASCARARRRDGAHELRTLERVLRRSRGEEAAQPLPARLGHPLVRDRRLQPRLPVLPELGHLQVEGRRHPRGAASPSDRPTPPRRSAAAGRLPPQRPTIFLEYAIDIADACHDLGLQASPSPPATSAPSPAPSSMRTSTLPTSTSKGSPRTSTGMSAGASSARCSTRSSTSDTRRRCGSS